MAQDIFDDAQTFEGMGLRNSLLKGLAQNDFEKPTHIQAQLIPAILAGKDVIGQAKTGTGKTAAFGLPLIHRADKDVPMQALVLTPTRELANQVADELNQLGKATPIRATCIIGGESMRKQREDVGKGGHLIVGTPGRVLDMLGRGQISFDKVNCVVLDEVDRMLDIGFRDDIRKLLSKIKGEHQTVFVSATIEPEIEALARRFMKKDAEKIVTVSGSLTVSLVEQHYFSVQPWDKRKLLLHLLRHEEPDTTIVFCKTKATVNKVTRYLKDKGIPAREIHGDLRQTKRNSVMNSLRSGKLDVLIASDLAARGLDVDHISHVINYDLPEDPEVYIHRIGRTARVGRKGIAWSFVTPEEGQRLTEIEKLCGTMIEEMEYPDFVPGPPPKDIIEQREREAAREQRAKEAAAPHAPTPTDGLSDEELAAMFPGGVVPKSVPPRTLGSKFRRRGRR